MPGLDDLMARSQAAGGLMGGMPEMSDPAALPSPTPESEPGMEAPDVEQGLSIIEAHAESVDPATGDQIREHVNAIRELTANSAPAEEMAPMPEEAPPMEAPPEEPMP